MGKFAAITGPAAALAVFAMAANPVHGATAEVRWKTLTATAKKEKQLVDWLDDVLGNCAIPPATATGPGWTRKQVDQCEHQQRSARSNMRSTKLVVDTPVKILSVEDKVAKLAVQGWACVELSRVQCPADDLRCGHRYLMTRPARVWRDDTVCPHRPSSEIVAAIISVTLDDQTAAVWRRVQENPDAPGARNLLPSAQLLVSPTQSFQSKAAPIRKKIQNRWWVSRPMIRGLNLHVHAWRLQLDKAVFVGDGPSGTFALTQ